MVIIGILGGVASGKSLVAAQLERLGAAVLRADEVGHEVLRLPGVRDAVVRRFGEPIVGPDGQIDRARLAAIVFAPPPEGPAALAALERLTHPAIGRRLRERLDELAASGRQIAVLDAAVMIKAHWHRMCNVLVFVDVPHEVRQARALARGWSAEQFAAREAAQEPVAEKRRLAEFVLDNSQTAEYTQQQVEQMWHTLVG